MEDSSDDDQGCLPTGYKASPTPLIHCKWRRKLYPTLPVTCIVLSAWFSVYQCMLNFICVCTSVSVTSLIVCSFIYQAFCPSVNPLSYLPVCGYGCPCCLRHDTVGINPRFTSLVSLHLSHTWLLFPYRCFNVRKGDRESSDTCLPFCFLLLRDLSFIRLSKISRPIISLKAPTKDEDAPTETNHQVHPAPQCNTQAINSLNLITHNMGKNII